MILEKAAEYSPNTRALATQGRPEWSFWLQAGFTMVVADTWGVNQCLGMPLCLSIYQSYIKNVKNGWKIYTYLDSNILKLCIEDVFKKVNEKHVIWKKKNPPKCVFQNCFAPKYTYLLIPDFHVFFQVLSPKQINA